MDISTTKSNLKYGLEELKKSEYLLDEDEIVINDLLTDLQSANDEAKINLIQEEYNKLKLKIDTLKELYKHSLYFIKPGFLARINLFFKELMKLVNNSSSKLTIKSMLDNLEDKKFILSQTLADYIAGKTKSLSFNSEMQTIRDYAFYSFTELEEFTATSASSIGKSAFVGCTSLKKINIPKATKCDSSFDSKPAFTEFNVGLAVTDWKSTSAATQPTFYKNETIKMISLPNVTNIKAQAFLECKNLTSVYLTSESGKDIEMNAFKDCVNLETISAPHFSGTIQWTAFINCSKKLKKIDFPAITTVSNLAFQNCKKLTTISLPKCNTLAINAFSGALSSISEINIGTASTQAIFSNLSTLKKVTMSRATTITAKAFMSCTNLSDVSFPAAVTVGDSAFQDCSALSLIELPEATTINQKAFLNCVNLAYINAPKCTKINSSAFHNNTSSSTANINWDLLVVPKVATIGSSAFANCTNITYIDAPECSSIGQNAFMGCSISHINLGKLTTLTTNIIPKTVTSLDLPACTTINANTLTGMALTHVSIPNCTRIQTKAFMDCIKLSKITLEKIQTIEQSAFAGCEQLSQIVILASKVATLSNSNAFAGIHSNYKIYVPNNLVNSYKTAANWSTISNRIMTLGPMTSIAFSIYDMGDQLPCFKSIIQQDCKNLADVSIGYGSSYYTSGFYLRTPFYKGSSIAFHGHRKYCPISDDNKTITANKYIYNEKTKMYSEASENKYIYYTTDQQNLNNQNKWVKVNSFDEILINNPTSTNNLTTNKIFIIGRKDNEK